MAFNRLLLAATLLVWALFPGHGEAATAADFTYHTYTSATGSTPYRLFVPAGYVATTSYPLVMFLHGAGEAGTNNTSPLNNNANGALVFVSTANQAAYPCFMLVPQATSSGWSAAVRREHLPAIIASLRATYAIDPDRIAVTGLSLGGGGTWDQLAQNPTLYAAAVPICGWGGGNYAAFAGVPIWTFHSANDPTVSVTGTRNAISGVRAAGGDPIYTEYATGGHASWVPAYQNPYLVPWVMAQRRGLPRMGNPRLDITLPTTAPSYTTSAATLDLAGSGWASADITGVTWIAGGASGVATGTAAWSASGIPLIIGSNLVRFTASGTSWSSSLGGVTTFSDSVTVIRSTVMAVAPGITTQPANATVAAPATATLAVAASGSPSPSYQWSSAPSGSSTFTAISGATSASYTTPATSIGMSGTQYRCMATNSAGSATSNVAALTVNAGTAGTVATSVTAGGGSRDCGLGSGVVLLTLALAVGLCGRRTRL